ncbi:Y-family DNA polymerase [Lachnoclostridium sp. An181]|uniref:Y-family DNA polymerase n=1 Tax=Lachnoclostridium sp. An181 TaxID=1965575 RepID=UPI000B394153|nr:DNA polymerase IV [Lachnoclostridium sp. An181]OUP48679.1 DNA polymerase IV [Lachnoclostridium sp. An181]
MRIIFHIDVNSAYLSWTSVERLKEGKSDLREVPSIIGGNQKSRHGVVLAKSIPAKQYKIKTGEPVANALRKCPNLVMAPPDHKMYAKYSKELMKFLNTYTRKIEKVSIDECYMDFTDIAHRFHSPLDAAFEIKDRIYETYGFTVNVGISSNKLLAKMASDFEKPNKVHTLFPEEIKAKMWPLPLSELYMAGHSSVETLKKLDIHTIGDLAKADVELIEIQLKSHGRMLWEFANGIDDSPVQYIRQDAKGVGNSTTLPSDLQKREETEPVFFKLAKSVAERLKKEGQKANMVSTEIKYNNFSRVSHQKQLTKASNDVEEIYENAMELFDELWDGTPIRLLGIRTSKLVDEGEPEQLSLFDMELPKKKDEREVKIEEAMKKLEEKFGKGIVKKGV